ncbi:MAG: TlpA family protein disulfide reductase [Gammaproteobacteria bacterium]|nr:TlpA family protein disulfide reductase [Gammaproteobacteria bacterium]
MRYGIIVILCLTFFQVQATVGYKVGNTAPEFNLKAIDKTTYSLSALRKKGHVLLVFWAVECVYCYAHIKEFNQAHEQFKNKLTIAAINIGGEYPNEVIEYVNDNKLKYLILNERLNNLDVGESYHVLGTPTLVLISPQGKILFYGYGVSDLTRWIQVPESR